MKKKGLPLSKKYLLVRQPLCNIVYRGFSNISSTTIKNRVWIHAFFVVFLKIHKKSNFLGNLSEIFKVLKNRAG